MQKKAFDVVIFMSKSCPNLMIDGTSTEIDNLNITNSRSLYTYAGFIISVTNNT